jgi:LEA14-like dessication related protein
MKVPALGVLVFCFACALLCGCSSPLAEPTVTVTDLSMEEVSLTSLTVLARVQVVNPNPVGVTIANLSFDLFYVTSEGEQYLGHGGRENLVIPKESTTSFDIPVKIGSLQALQAIGVALNERSITLVVRGTAAVDLKVTTVKIPFEKRQVISPR